MWYTVVSKNGVHLAQTRELTGGSNKVRRQAGLWSGCYKFDEGMHGRYF